MTTPIDYPAGAVAVDGGRPYVFARGGPSRLWCNWWTGSAWSWSDQGAPPGTAISMTLGAVLVDGGRPHVFFRGGDGQVWVNWWTGSAWQWSGLGAPPSTAIV